MGMIPSAEVAGFPVHRGELSRQIVQSLDDDVDDRVLPFDAAVHKPCLRMPRDLAKALPRAEMYDQIGRSGLVFDGDERDAFRRARPLTHQHHPGDFHTRFMRRGIERGVGRYAQSIQPFALKGERMRTQR